MNDLRKTATSMFSDAESKTLIDLENKFWKAIQDQDADTATDLLQEPALMVSAHGAFKFGHGEYRKMAEEGAMVVTSYELSNIDVTFPSDSTAVLTYRVKQALKTRADGKETVEEMNDSSTWVKEGGRWLCAIHTETPAQEMKKH